MSAVERVHAKKMRGDEGRTNVCSREGTCEKDEGGEEGRKNVCGKEGACEKDERGGEDKRLR